MSTNLEKATPERVEELHMLAGKVRARLELAGLRAKVWSSYGRLRVYTENGLPSQKVEIRFLSHCMEIRGRDPAERVHTAIHDLYYNEDAWPC